jgi:TolB protein
VRVAPILALVAAGVLAACKQPPRAPEQRVLLHEAGIENAYPRLSNDGREILYQSNRGGAWQLHVLDLATGASRALTHEANNNLPDWSADNQRIAFVSDRDGNEEIYVANADGSDAKRLTINPGRDLHPYFSADGKTLLYNSQRAGAPFDVYALDLVTGDEVRVTATPEDETCARYSPDGKQMIVLRNDARADDVWLLDARGEHNLTNTPHIRDGWPVFDPRGRWVYFAGMDRGTFSLYRVRTDGTRREQLTTAAPGEEHARPVLSRDGTRLIFNIRRGGGIDIVELSPIAG